MKEAAVENYLAECVHELGGIVVKLGLNGWPDRMVLLPGGICGFIELKAPGKEPRALQLQRLALLTRLGFLAEWADSLSGVRQFLASLCKRKS